MKKIYLILSILFSQPAISQVVIGEKRDSIKLRYDKIEGDIKLLKSTNDSLNKELYYFRTKEDFYVMAVDRQGSHFEWLLGFGLGVLGLLSLGYFETRFRSIKVSVKYAISSLTTEFSKHEKKYKQIETELARESMLLAYSSFSTLTNKSTDAMSTYIRTRHLLDLIFKQVHYYTAVLENNELRNDLEKSIEYHLVKVMNDLDNIIDEGSNFVEPDIFIHFLKGSEALLKRFNNTVDSLQNEDFKMVLMPLRTKLYSIKKAIDHLPENRETNPM